MLPLPDCALPLTSCVFLGLWSTNLNSPLHLKTAATKACFFGTVNTKGLFWGDSDFCGGKLKNGHDDESFYMQISSQRFQTAALVGL